MTSEQRVYVYLQLPGTLEVVTAGLYTLDVRDGVRVGRFRYNPAYLASAQAVPVEPYELPLREQPFDTVKLKGVFGALRDASPDAWGRRVIERDLGRTDLTEAEFLLHSPEDRAGALSFGHGKQAPAPFRDYNKVIHLEQLLQLAEEIRKDDPPHGKPHPQAAQVVNLLRPGTSMGGARPKNVVEDDEGLWIAKFPDAGDRWNNARVERAMLELARECGINAATSKLASVGGSDALLVKRFDRERVEGGFLRARMVSGLTLLGTEDTYESRDTSSYLILADEIRRRSARPKEDLVELLRRMTFNALVSNMDDHPRNHAMIASGRDFVLSPAYDLTPNPAVSAEKRDLAMSVGRWNRHANRENLLSGHAQLRIGREEALAIIDAVRATVRSRWQFQLHANGASREDIDRVSGAFDYPGFMLDPGAMLAAR